jgi:hypothetical protein
VDVQQLSDREEIREVIQQYFRGVDRLDYDLIREVFHDDAHVDYGEVFIRGGVDSLMEQLRSDDYLAGFARTVHFVGNLTIELRGDVAFTETYCQARHVGGPGHAWEGKFVTVYDRYIARFEKRGGVWKVADLVVPMEWGQIEDQANDEWIAFPAESLGRRDRSDPSYQR